MKEKPAAKIICAESPCVAAPFQLFRSIPIAVPATFYLSSSLKKKKKEIHIHICMTLLLVFLSYAQLFLLCFLSFFFSCLFAFFFSLLFSQPSL